MRKKVYLFILPLLAGFLLALAVNASSGPPGSSSNPVITKSYADKTLQPLKDRLEDLQFEAARLKETGSRGDTPKFVDVPSTHWAYNDIGFMVEEGVISGMGNGKFGPNIQARRCELAVMLVKALNLPTANVQASFKDVPQTHWAYSYIAAVQKAGIISGFPGGEFKPNEYVTRAQMAAMLTKAFNLQEKPGGEDFKDVSEDYWAYDAICQLADNGITSGYEDKTFRPGVLVRRAEVAVFLAKAMHVSP